jgi:hypothetical protein
MRAPREYTEKNGQRLPMRGAAAYAILLIPLSKRLHPEDVE